MHGVDHEVGAIIAKQQIRFCFTPVPDGEKPQGGKRLRILGAVIAVALVTSCAESGRSITDRELTRQLSDPRVHELRLTQAFGAAGLEYVCLLDEYTSASHALSYYRSLGQPTPDGYSGAIDKVPEGMFGLLVVSSNKAELHLVDRDEVRLGQTESTCFAPTAIFRRNEANFWILGNTAD
jgi:hypothetical protein